MTATTIEIGTKVEYHETYRGYKTYRIGVVVELSGERARVKWSELVYPTGRRPETKRTWIRLSALVVIS
jgi:hypothetical protein